MKHINTLLAAILTLSMSWAQAQATYESTGSRTNWDDPAAWTLAAGSPADSDADGIPDSDDGVHVLPGHTIFVNVTSACSYLNISDDGSFTEFQVLVGDTLNITGNMVIESASEVAEMIITLKGVVNIGGILDVSVDHEETAVELDIDFGAILNINGIATSKFFVLANSMGCFINNNGTINSAGPLRIRSYNMSSVLVTNNGQWNASKDLTLRIQDAGSTLTFQNKSYLNCDDGLNLRAAYGADPADLVLDMRFTNSSLNLFNDLNLQTDGGTVEASNTMVSTFTYDGSNPQTIVTDSKVKYHHLVVKNGTSQVFPDGNLTATNFFGDFTVSSGSDFSDAGQSIAISGDLINNGGSYTQTTDLTIAGSYTAVSGASHSADGNITIDNNFNNTGAFTSTGNGCDISIKGSWSNLGTYSYTSGDTVLFNGTIGTSMIEGSATFYNLILNHSGYGAVVDGGTQYIAGVLDIDQGVLETGNEVVLLSNSSGTAQLADITGGNIVGKVTVQRYLNMNTAGWVEVTSPVAGTTLADWNNDGLMMTGFPNSDYPNWPSAASPFVSVWDYDENLADGTKDNGWTEATDISNATAADSGHRIYIGNGQYTLSVFGKPNKNAQEFTLKYQNSLPAETAADASEKGWNLIGNPYPCTIDWDNIDAADKVNIDDMIYIFSAEAGNYGVYYGGDGPNNGTNGVDNRIAHSQAFWVHATADNPMLTINEDDKTVFDKPYVKSNNIAELLKIRVSSDANGYYDEAILRVHEKGANNHSLEAPKFETINHLKELAPSLSIVADNKALSVCLIDDDDAHQLPIQVRIGSQAQGNYTLDFGNVTTFLPHACLILEDLQTGELIDLRNSSWYTFKSNPAVREAKFVLHIISNRSSAIESCADVVAANHEGRLNNSANSTTNNLNATLFDDGSSVYLNVAFPEPTIAEISIVNALGQEVHRLNKQTYTNHQLQLPMPVQSGVYLIRIETSDGQKVLKHLF